MRGISRMAAAIGAAAGIVNSPVVVVDGPAPKRFHRLSRLNRSRRWPRAETYAEARAKSPYPDRPVR